MFVFRDLIFTMINPQNSWHLLWDYTKDEREVIIETVHKRENNNNTVSLQIHATIRLNTNPTITNEIIECPSEEMMVLNDFLHYYSQLISVTEVEKVSISSPSVSWGFVPGKKPKEKMYHVPFYLHSKLKHVFSVHPHILMLVLRQYESKSYEGNLCWHFKPFHLVQMIHLDTIPHFTTLQKAAARLSDILLHVAISRFIGIVSPGMIFAGADATGFKDGTAHHLSWIYLFC